MCLIGLAFPNHNLCQDKDEGFVHLTVEGRLLAQHWGEGEEEELKGVGHGQEGEQSSLIHKLSKDWKSLKYLKLLQR